MIKLNDIRKLVLKQEKELDDLIKSYLKQSLYTELDLNSLKKEIQNAIETNNIEEAKILFEKYEISTDIYNPEFYSIKGNIDIIEGNFESALDNFLKGLELDNQNLDLLYNLGYLYSLAGNAKNAIKYYKLCMDSTNDNIIIDELNILINQQKSKLNYTIIILDEDIEYKALQYICSSNNDIIKIIERDDIKYNNKYYKDSVTYCEVEKGKTKEMLDYFVRRNDNCIILTSSIKNINLLYEYKQICKLVYYISENIYTSKLNDINHNIIMYKEKQICDICDFLLTDNITAYIYKNILEERNNVFLLDHLIINNIDINSIVNNNFSLEKEQILDYAKNLEDEYTKSMNILAIKYTENDIDNCINIINYMYSNFNNIDVYYIYLTFLTKIKDYNSLLYVILNDNYLEDDYKAELIYLNILKEEELIDFIINIKIKNYSKIEDYSDNNIEYKKAIYNFEISKFDESYTNYSKLLNLGGNICNSPITNRNLYYLTYAMFDDNYKRFYKSYKEILEECMYD